MKAKAVFQLQVDDGSHRQSDWLELFFDLAFVICVGVLAQRLAGAEGFAILPYVACFVPVWWVWNQFTWYSVHFNNGDFWFRAMMFAGAGGALALAAGLRTQAQDHRLFVFAYLFLHLLLLLGWIRAYVSIALYRPYIRMKMIGLCIGLVFWSASLLVDEPQWLWAAGVSGQIAMPVLAWATVKKMISVHHAHLSERHGLFTIIVLGEGLLSIATGIGENQSSWLSAVAALACLVGLWWVYFEWSTKSFRTRALFSTFAYNYGHFVLFASLGAVASGFSRWLTPHDATASGAPLIVGGVGFFLAALVGMNWTARGTHGVSHG